MHLVLIARGLHLTTDGVVLCLLYLDLATSYRVLYDMLSHLRAILQVRDLRRRLTTALSYALYRSNYFVLLLHLTWMLRLLRLL